MTTRYINRRDHYTGQLETVDELPCNTREEIREASRCIKEYRLSDPAGSYKLSQRPTKDWEEIT